jgi:hypothetical protein
MNEPWKITLFGGLAAWQGDKTVTRFKSQKIALLLAYLAAHLRQTQLYGRPVLSLSDLPLSKQVILRLS